MKLTSLLLLGATLALGATTAGNAAISAGPTVGGLATFTDSNTGRNWLKTNTFFNQSPTNMINAASAAGFILANRTDVEALLGTLPIDNGQWAGYAAVMGDAPNRDLIWAAYGPITPGGNYGYAFAYGNFTAWSFFDDVTAADTIENADTPEADMNIWAYTGGGGGGGGGAVPEPASWAMLIAGFGLVGAMARRRRIAAA